MSHLLDVSRGGFQVCRVFPGEFYGLMRRKREIEREMYM